MTENNKTLKQLKKATNLVNRTYHKNGPKSFNHGVGALIKVLKHNDGTLTNRELVKKMSFDRACLKDVVKKAQHAGFVTFEKSGEKHTYTVSLTDEGKRVAEKRGKAQAEMTDKIVSALSDEEIAQLNSITEKLIVNCKEIGAHGKRMNTKKCKHRGHHGHKHHGGKCKCDKH